jgi:hypothetical protein
MKVIATGYQKQRLVLDNVDSLTATMTASVLNEIRGRQFLNADDPGPKPWWFYHAEDDAFEVRGKAA